MSTSVIISTAKPIKIDLDDISGRKYYYGVRDIHDIVRRGEVGNYMVFFDFMKFGRGVEVTFISECKLEIRLNTPASTSDLELFMYLIKKMVKATKVKELICEEEVYSVDALEKIREIAKANMQSGLDFISRMSKENVEIIAVQGPIAIDDEERKQFAGGQKEFDKYLDSKQRLQVTNELLMPIVAETNF